MVESVDDALGRILDVLDQLGIRDRTAIVFTSDNGGQASLTDMQPLRAGKGSAYEGGVRVPLIVSWPGVTTPGTTSDAWLTEVAAQLPTPNPHYDSARDR